MSLLLVASNGAAHGLVAAPPTFMIAEALVLRLRSPQNRTLVNDMVRPRSSTSAESRNVSGVLMTVVPDRDQRYWILSAPVPGLRENDQIRSIGIVPVPSPTASASADSIRMVALALTVSGMRGASSVRYGVVPIL
jgi:hypothetical protein